MLASAFFNLAPAVEGLEWFGLAEFEEQLCAGDPVGALGVDQVDDHVEWAHGFFAFVSERPGFRQSAKERVEGGGSAGEERDCVFQIVGHLVSPLSIFARSGCRRAAVDGVERRIDFTSQARD